MKITKTMYLHWQHDRYAEGPSFDLYSCDMTDTFKNSVLVGTREITVEVPDDFDPRHGLIDTLRKQQKTVLADAQLKATEIEGQIQQLLAIECKTVES